MDIIKQVLNVDRFLACPCVEKNAMNTDNRTNPSSQVLPLISELDCQLLPDLLKLAEDVRVALEILNYAVKISEHVDFLADILALQEARDNCAFDGVKVSVKDLYARLFREKGSENAEHVLNCQKAMYEGYHRINECGAIALGDLEEIVAMTLGCTSGIRSNMIGFSNSTHIQIQTKLGESVSYIPPHGKDLLQKHLADLWEYFNNDELYTQHPLIKLALAYIQFMRVYPYGDASGRIGRIMSTLWMCQRKYLNFPFLCLSGQLNANHSKHQNLLYAFSSLNDNDNLYECVNFVLQTWLKSAEWSLQIVEQIKSLYKYHSSIDNFENMQRHSNEMRSVIDIIFQKKYVRISDLVERGIHRQTASGYLSRLIDFGLLQKLQVGKDNLYINSKVQKLFEQERTVL